MAEGERLARVLLHKKDADPARVDLPHAIEHEPLERRGQPCRRLVEEQQPRLDHEGHRYGEHLALAAREGAGAGAPAVGEDGEQLDDGARPLALRVGSGPSADGEVLPHAERGEDVGLLRHVAEAARDDASGAGAGDVGARERDAARPGRTSPASVLNKVDFPAPFGPMTATSSPSSTRSESPRRMSLSP